MSLKTYINKILKEELIKGNLPALDHFILEIPSSEDIPKEAIDSINLKVLSKIEQYLFIEQKLNKPENINTIGELIELWHIKNDIEQEKTLTLSLFERNELSKIFKNTIDLTSINIYKFAKLIKLLEIKIDIACNLIEKSIKLFQMNPSTSEAMARYSYAEGLGEKNKSMKDGLNELLLKASSNKKFTHECIIPTKIPKDEFIKLFIKEYKKC